ncbi:hypothetical protein ACFX10_010003 [Malus domestica]
MSVDRLIEAGEAKRRKREGVRVGAPSEPSEGPWIGMLRLGMEDRELETENSRREGRRWVLRRPENQPRRWEEGDWACWAWVRRRRAMGSTRPEEL